MASPKPWCHLHSQPSAECGNVRCVVNSNNLEYAGYREESGEFEFESIGEAAIGLHEIYLSHIKAGFTEEQALWLVGATLTGSPGPVPGGITYELKDPPGEDRT